MNAHTTSRDIAEIQQSICLWLHSLGRVSQSNFSIWSPKVTLRPYELSLKNNSAQLKSIESNLISIIYQYAEQFWDLSRKNYKQIFYY